MIYIKKVTFPVIIVLGQVIALLGLFAVIGYAQINAEDLISDLEGTAPYERGSKALELSEEGVNAVPGLVEVIEKYPQQEDAHLVSTCIIAISLIGPDAREESTETLLVALDSFFAEIRYSAARALGRLWAGEGSEETEIIQKINTNLLSYAIRAEGAERFAPGLAMTSINDDIPIDAPANQAQSLEPRELLSQVFPWLIRREARLTGVEDWNWPLLVQTFLQRPDSEVGRNAKDMLLSDKPIEAIDFLFSRMKDIDPSEALWKRMSELVSELADVEFDREKAQNAAQEDTYDGFMFNREADWYNNLTTHKDDKHRNYAWMKLEEAINAAKFRAYKRDFERLELIKEVIRHQFDSTEHIPEDASPSSRRLMREPLRLKNKILTAIQDYEKAEDTNDRISAVQTLLDVSHRDKGKEIAELFLEDFFDIALAEDSPRILSDLGIMLTNVLNVRVVLDEDREIRRQELEVKFEEIQ